MRFLILTPGLHPDLVGGAWRVAAAQAAELARCGHDVDVVTARQHPGAPGVETRDGDGFRGLPSRARCAEYARERFGWNPRRAACERAARELAHAP